MTECVKLLLLLLLLQPYLTFCDTMCDNPSVCL